MQHKIAYLAILISFCSLCFSATLITAPIPTITPGLANKELSKEVICDKNWSTKKVRKVSASTKKKVYAEYDATNHQGYCALNSQGCEIDHLIPLELGGSNDIKNLWPQPYGGKINAHQKDALETRLHDMVCENKIDLDTARTMIAKDWIGSYNDIIKNKKGN